MWQIYTSTDVLSTWSLWTHWPKSVSKYNFFFWIDFSILIRCLWLCQLDYCLLSFLYRPCYSLTPTTLILCCSSLMSAEYRRIRRWPGTSSVRITGSFLKLFKPRESGSDVVQSWAFTQVVPSGRLSVRCILMWEQLSLISVSNYSFEFSCASLHKLYTPGSRQFVPFQFIPQPLKKTF